MPYIYAIPYTLEEEFRLSLLMYDSMRKVPGHVCKYPLHVCQQLCVS